MKLLVYLTIHAITENDISPFIIEAFEQHNDGTSADLSLTHEQMDNLVMSQEFKTTIDNVINERLKEVSGGASVNNFCDAVDKKSPRKNRNVVFSFLVFSKVAYLHDVYSENGLTSIFDLKDNVDTSTSDEDSNLLPININVDKPSKGFDKKEAKKLNLEDDFSLRT